jgi:hypothetical protein
MEGGGGVRERKDSWFHHRSPSTEAAIDTMLSLLQFGCGFEKLIDGFLNILMFIYGAS